MKSIAALLAVALALASVSALACDGGSGKIKDGKAQTTTPDKKS